MLRSSDEPGRPPMRRERLADRFGDGLSREAFARTDWVLLLGVSGIFGSAFLWISLALRSLEPGVVAVGRLVLAVGALALVPAARRRIDRADWGIVLAAGVIGQGGPAFLFAAAEQHISSALTGMLVSAVPVLATAINTLVTRRLPGPRQLLGLAVGFAGIVMLAVPDLGAGASSLGVGMVLLAVLGYAIAGNLYPRVTQVYGPLPVTLWGQAAAAIVLLPIGALAIGGSRLEVVPVLALLILGVVGTGIARAMMVALIGRVGPRRGPVISYVIPIVALILGVVVLGESVQAVQIAGVVVALLGGFLVTRAE